MRVAVLGTGMVGRALASRFAELGHEVMIGTRDVATTLGRTEPDFMGNPPLATWLDVHPDLRLGTFAEAAGSAELVVNATAGDASVQALEAAGAENLAGKVLLDRRGILDVRDLVGERPRLQVEARHLVAQLESRRDGAADPAR